MVAQPGRPGVRVLLDTGPTEDEVIAIQAMFADAGMDAVAEGHSYGGPPPTSAFLIVVNSPLAPFLDSFEAKGTDGPGQLQSLVGRLQAMRADRSRWGSAHGVTLEDSQTGHCVHLPGSLPARAYQALMDVDVSRLDPASSPVQLEWSVALDRWQARLTTAPRRVARWPPQRWQSPQPPRARELTEAEVSELWRLAGSDTPSVVTWQRARIVLASALGWSIPSIAQQTVMSTDRVRAVIANFNQDDFDSLHIDHPGGERPKPTSAEEREAWAIAARSPTDFGLPHSAWSARALGEFLVAEGVVEDVDLDWLTSVLGGTRTQDLLAVARGSG